MMEIKIVLHGAKHVLEIMTAVLLSMMVGAHAGGCSQNIRRDMQQCTSEVMSMYHQIKPRAERGNYSGVPRLCRNLVRMNTCLHDELQDCGILGRQYLLTVRRTTKDVRKLCKDYKKRKNRTTTTTAAPEEEEYASYTEPTEPYVITSRARHVEYQPASTQGVASNSNARTRTSLITCVFIGAFSILALIT